MKKPISGKQEFAEMTVHHLIQEINEFASVTVDAESLKYIRGDLGDLLLARDCFDRSLERMRSANGKSV